MSERISRRDLLIAAGVIAAELGLDSLTGAAEPETPPDARPIADDPLRVAYLGEKCLSTSVLLSLAKRQDVRLVAVAGQSNLHVPPARGKRPRMIESDHAHRALAEMHDVEAVIVNDEWARETSAVPDLLRAGKFVGAMDIACATVQAGHELIAAARCWSKNGSDGGLMLLEQPLYRPAVMAVQAMADQGVFGDLSYAAAIHVRNVPTLCRWMGINRSDRLVSLAASKNVILPSVLIRTARGRLIELGATEVLRTRRMPQFLDLSLHGTRGAYDKVGPRSMVYLHGRTSGDQWEPFDLYAGDYRPPGHILVRHALPLMLSEFVRAARTGVSPTSAAEVATWRVLAPLIEQSLAAGGRAVAIPDFTAA